MMIRLIRELMMKILLLLPFESILACRLASKQLRNIIDDHEFLNRYHDKSPIVLVAIDDSLCCVMETYFPMESNGDKITVDGFHPPPIKVRRISTESTHRFAYSLTLAAPNRIACFRKEKEGNFFLYNLFTGASLSVSFQQGIQRILMCSGFGYDCYEDDYKILIASRNYEFLTNEFHVYSTRTSAWRSLDDSPCTIYESYDWKTKHCCPAGPHQACCFSGILHWIFYEIEKDRDIILTYDLHTSRFSELMPPPNCFPIYDGNLIELGGDLCFWYHKSLFTHVYVMKEYGIKESWTKLFTIYPSVLKSSIPYLGNIEPMVLRECEDGRRFVLFLCRLSGSLHWYDIGNGTLLAVCRR